MVARLGKDADTKAKDVESLASRLEKESEAKATAAANAIARIDKTLDRLNETVAVRSDIDMNSRRTDERIRTIVDSLNEVRHDISSFRQLTPAPIK